MNTGMGREACSLSGGSNTTRPKRQLSQLSAGILSIVTCSLWAMVHVCVRIVFFIAFNYFLTDDFSGQGSGMICFYSLKNPSHPE